MGNNVLVLGFAFVLLFGGVSSAPYSASPASESSALKLFLLDFLFVCLVESVSVACRDCQWFFLKCCVNVHEVGLVT